MYAYVYIVPSFSTTLEFTRNVLLSAIVIRSTIGFFLHDSGYSSVPAG